MVSLAVLIALYFLRTILAAHKGHRVGGILILNLFFGWTVIGWFALLLYALLSAPRFVVCGSGYYPGAYYRAWQRW